MQKTLPMLKHVAGFIVSGFAVRTQNRDEFNPDTAKLPQVWQQFYTSTLSKEGAVYGVYSDYDSDANGHYTLTAGISDKVQDTDLISITINSGNYLVFQGKGQMPQTVAETWQRVWEYFATECPYQRCFMTDFEQYSNGDEVAIYIGVK